MTGQRSNFRKNLTFSDFRADCGKTVRDIDLKPSLSWSLINSLSFGVYFDVITLKMMRWEHRKSARSFVHWVTSGVWRHWPDPDPKWTTRNNRRCLKWIANSNSGHQNTPKRHTSARSHYRSTEVTDLTLTFSNLEKVNGHCANVKSASCDSKTIHQCVRSVGIYTNVKQSPI